MKDYPCISFTSKEAMNMFNEDQAGVVVSTYFMISFSQDRKSEVEAKMDIIRRIPWGLLILDEVQMVPANQFRKVTS